MAEWSRNKVDSTQLNNGNEFDNNSDFTLDEMNAIVNGGLYSQDFAEHLADTPDTSEANNSGPVTIAFIDNIVNGKTYKKFKFSNLKGQKGDTGETGATGATPNISVSATTLSPGSQATATRSGTNENPHITFGIPKGEPGDAGTFDDSLSETSTNAVQNKVITNELNIKINNINSKTKPLLKNYWKSMSWNGLTNFHGGGIWSDGDNIYYSSGAYSYVLDRETFTWEEKNWNGLTNFYGGNIWSDGENIYYSSGVNSYVLDRETSTWEEKNWNVTGIYGYGIWSDGKNIYYSLGQSYQYILNANGEFEETEWKVFPGVVVDLPISGNDVWKDGDNIYYSSGAYSYVLDRETSTWKEKNWNGLTNFYGQQIWSDGENIYCSNGAYSYVLDRETSTWEEKNWNVTGIHGDEIWSDGKNIYQSYYNTGEETKHNILVQPLTIRR